IRIYSRHSMPATGRNRLRAVTDHLTALEELGNEWMRLESLKLSVRIDQRIAIVEPRHIPEIHYAILHSVNPASPVSPLIRRKAKRVCNAARRITIVRQFPELLYAEAVNLRLASFIEAQSLDQLFR